MTNVRLRDDQWTEIHNFLVGDPNVYVGRDTSACRHFGEAILWMNRSGAQWRLLPADYGNWNSVYKRYARWCDQGVWERMLNRFADDADMENSLIDSTAVRAHPCAACAQKSDGQVNQALGRSRGGFSSVNKCPSIMRSNQNRKYRGDMHGTPYSGLVQQMSLA
jgi:transposase